MTGDELTAMMAELGWSGPHLAKRMQTTGNTVWRMQHGLRPVPPDLAKALRHVVAALQRNPIPTLRKETE